MSGAKYAAALDLAGTLAGFAVLKDGAALFDLATPMRGRESARLAAWVLDELQQHGLTLEEISEWTVGAGPGSFTGMRLAAALVSGWSFGKPEIRRRCVPTAVALAAAAGAGTVEGEKIGCLFDGRNRELIYFPLQWHSGEWVPAGGGAVYDGAHAAEMLCSGGAQSSGLIAWEGECPALAKLLPDEVMARIRRVDAPRYAALAAARYRKFDGDLTDLVYIRPAVFTAPVNA